MASQEELVPNTDKKVLNLGGYDANAKSFELCIRWQGFIDEQGGDTRLLLRTNDSKENYQSFVVADGHYHAGEWNPSGLFVGRSGWHLDTDLSFIYRIVSTKDRAKTGYGHATGYSSNNHIIGWASHGFWVKNGDHVNSVSLWKVGPGIVSTNFFDIEIKKLA